MANRQKIAVLVVIAIGSISTMTSCHRFAAKMLHPGIETYYVISLEVSDLIKRVDSGDPFTITLGKKQIELLVKPVPFVTEKLKILDRKKDKIIKRKFEEAAIYAGFVVGSETTSDARFTISKGLLIGSVRFDGEWWFVEPLKKFQAKAASSDYIAYRTKDTSFQIPLGKDTPDKIPGSSFPQNNLRQSISSSLATRSVRLTTGRTNKICIVLVADRDLLNWIEQVALVEWRDNPELFMLSVLNYVNGVYQREIGYQFETSHILIDSDNSFLSSNNKDTLLNQLVNFVTSELGDLRHERERIIHRAEVAHLLTGKDIDSDTVGYAENPGHYGFTQISFLHVQGYRFPLYYQNMLIMAHELGHNFNGLHEQADEWCVTSFIWCWDHVRTIMWDALYDDNVDEFSDGNRNSSHNNLNRINTDWERRVGACDGPTVDSPELTSPTHEKGQPSCNRVMTVNWSAPATPVGIQGYSYTVVSQDDPYYDQNRTPDDTIDLNHTVTTFTTSPLEPGHVWEFNLVAIDDVGTRSRFYSSFWAKIESCSVDVWVVPRENAVFSVGEWVNIYYGPVIYDGNDASGCYAVILDLMKGSGVVQNIVTNMSYTLSYGFRVPEVAPASDYNIRIHLDRKPICDQYSGFPASMSITSSRFSVAIQ